MLTTCQLIFTATEGRKMSDKLLGMKTTNREGAVFMITQLITACPSASPKSKLAAVGAIKDDPLIIANLFEVLSTMAKSMGSCPSLVVDLTDDMLTLKWSHESNGEFLTITINASDGIESEMTWDNPDCPENNCPTLNLPAGAVLYDQMYECTLYHTPS